MQWIEGGITAAKGYKASGEHLGIRKNPGKRDVALVVSETPRRPPAATRKIWSRARRCW